MGRDVKHLTDRAASFENAVISSVIVQVRVRFRALFSFIWLVPLLRTPRWPSLVASILDCSDRKTGLNSQYFELCSFRSLRYRLSGVLICQLLN